VFVALTRALRGLSQRERPFWRLWAISGLFSHTFSGAFQFSCTDQQLTDAGLNESSIALYRSGDGAGTWVEIPSTVDPVGNTISTTNPQTAFSLWSIAQSSTVVDKWDEY